MKATPSRMTLTLWGRKLTRGEDRAADQWWFERGEPLEGPTVRVNHHTWTKGAHGAWLVELVLPGNVVCKCTGPTLEGCIDHLNATELPAKWFPGPPAVARIRAVSSSSKRS